MNREIKFRAWNDQMKKMYDVINLTCSDSCDALVAKSGDAQTAHKLHGDFPLMQYTGLKDKNGVEIYEGDLVWHGRLELEYPLQVSIGGYWPTEGDCGWGVHVHNEDETFVEGVIAFNQDNNLEVIGNIYENPELLKV